MIDGKAFRSLSYGVYIIGAQTASQKAGCVVNTVVQVTSSPARITVAVNKDNVTSEAVRQAGALSVVVLAEDVPMEMIGTFGFRTSADTDKFAEWRSAEDVQGMPYPLDHTVARLSAKVVDEVDLGSHVLFVADVVEAERTDAGAPLTYADYHAIKGGKTPPKASSYIAETSHEEALAASADVQGGRVGWRCQVCGHVEWVDELPEGYVCPVCGMGPEMFERFVEE